MRTQLLLTLPLVLAPAAAQGDRSAPPRPAEGAPSSEQTAAKEPRGLIRSTGRAAPGYTLVAPLRSGETYLIDNAGATVRTWKSDAPTGQSVYLLDNGHLLRCERVDNDVFFGGGQGGRLREFDWDGALVWEHTLSDAHLCLHHDVEVMPNGNVLVIAWEARTREQALAAGRDPAELGEDFWPDCVLEIEPVRPRGGKVVWEWHAFDHLIQDRDRARAGFGDVAAHPERIDVNAGGAERAPGATPEELERLQRLGYAGGDEPPRGRRDPEDGAEEPERRDRDGPGRTRADWLHTNGIDYRADLDLIVLSVHNLSEVWVIDHSTTSAQAAGSRGGRYGKGGDLLVRWGNPRTHKAGTAADQKISVQHDTQWIASGLPGAGRVLLFNNGGRGGQRGRSTVDEIVLPVDAGTLSKPMDARALAALQPAWTYTSEAISAGHVSGAQRLANGNTLITNGESGRVVEVTPEGEVAWEWLNPFGGDFGPGGGRGPRGPRAGPPPDGPRGEGGRGGPPAGPRRGPGGRGPGGDMRYGLFRVDRYAPDHPGLAALAAQTGGAR